MTLNKSPYHPQGFTLIELLVVMSVIGMLVGLIVNNLADARARGRDSKRKSELTQLKTALRLYYNDYQSYPAGSGTLDGCGEDGDEECGTSFSAGSGDTLYMRTLPPDFTYTQVNSDSFIVTVTLENASDPDLTTSQANCPGGAPYEDTDFVVCND